jgi:hypothetical protein
MQRNRQKALAQPVVTQMREDDPANDNRPKAGCEQHVWRFLMPGFQMCTNCGAIRRKPSNGTDSHAPRRRFWWRR